LRRNIVARLDRVNRKSRDILKDRSAEIDPGKGGGGIARLRRNATRW